MSLQAIFTLHRVLTVLLLVSALSFVLTSCDNMDYNNEKGTSRLSKDIRNLGVSLSSIVSSYTGKQETLLGSHTLSGGYGGTYTVNKKSCCSLPCRSAACNYLCYGLVALFGVAILLIFTGLIAYGILRMRSPMIDDFEKSQQVKARLLEEYQGRLLEERQMPGLVSAKGVVDLKNSNFSQLLRTLTKEMNNNFTQNQFEELISGIVVRNVSKRTGEFYFGIFSKKKYPHDKLITGMRMFLSNSDGKLSNITLIPFSLEYIDKPLGENEWEGVSESLTSFELADSDPDTDDPTSSIICGCSPKTMFNKGFVTADECKYLALSSEKDYNASGYSIIFGIEHTTPQAREIYSVNTTVELLSSKSRTVEKPTSKETTTELSGGFDDENLESPLGISDVKMTAIDPFLRVESDVEQQRSIEKNVFHGYYSPNARKETRQRFHNEVITHDDTDQSVIESPNKAGSNVKTDIQSPSDTTREKARRIQPSEVLHHVPSTSTTLARKRYPWQGVPGKEVDSKDHVPQTSPRVVTIQDTNSLIFVDKSQKFHHFEVKLPPKFPTAPSPVIWSNYNLDIPPWQYFRLRDNSGVVYRRWNDIDSSIRQSIETKFSEKGIAKDEVYRGISSSQVVGLYLPNSPYITIYFPQSFHKTKSEATSPLLSSANHAGASSNSGNQAWMTLPSGEIHPLKRPVWLSHQYTQLDKPSSGEIMTKLFSREPKHADLKPRNHFNYVKHSPN